MLEVPLEWNEVPDLMMEEEDILLRPLDLPNGGEMQSPDGGKNSKRKTISGRRNNDICPQYSGEYKI